MKKKRKIKCHELYSSMFNSRPPGRSERGLLIGSPEREYIRCKGTQSPGCRRERASEYLPSPFNLPTFPVNRAEAHKVFVFFLPRQAAATVSRRLECKTLEKKWRKLPLTPR